MSPAPIDEESELLPDPTGTPDWARLFVSSAWSAWRGPGFPDVERFCFFIGYSRSGHSLVGSLLNAHPNVLISHELDALRFVKAGFRRAQLYSLIRRRDEAFESLGRAWTGYDYSVPGGHQGEYGSITVIGDKRGRKSALEIAERPELLERLRRTVGVPIRVIHITRNPFDNIVTEANRRLLTLDRATSWYQRTCASVAVTRTLLDESELLDLKYESFASDPRGVLADLCRFLGVDAPDSFLDACAAVVWPSTKRRRDTVDWSPEDLARVEALIQQYDFLSHYTFE